MLEVRFRVCLISSLVLGFCFCRSYGLAYSMDALFMSGSPILILLFGFVFSVFLVALLGLLWFCSV